MSRFQVIKLSIFLIFLFGILRNGFSIKNAGTDEEEPESSSSPAVSTDNLSEEQREIVERDERKKRRESRQPRAPRAPRASRTSRSDSSAISSSSSVPSNDQIVASPRDEGPMSDPWSDNFLILLRAREGISHWKYVVNDFILLGMDTNRTLVEPCIKDGRIAPCMHLMANETLTLSTVIDLSIIKSHFPELRIITWAEYMLKYHSRMTSIMCYRKNSRDFNQAVLDFDGALIKPASSEGDDASYEDCVRKSKNFGNSVYLHCPWKEETLRRGMALTMTIPWKYSPFQHTIATRIMKDAKIDLDKYFVFNWRMGATPRKHLLPCAKMLIAFSEEWLEKFDGDRLNAMIVTDLSFAKNDPVWGDLTSQQSIDLQGNITNLLDTNFFKIETSNAVKGTIKQFPRYRDPIFLTIWEIIISEKASLFVTCSQSNEVCDYCSKIKSKFSEDIIRNRYMARLNSYDSWSINTYTKTRPVSIAEYLVDSNKAR